MAITSYPFEDADTTESQYSALFRELQESGVFDSVGGNALKVAASGSGVTIQPGAALLRGFVVSSDAVETIPNLLSTYGAGTHLVVARLKPVDNEIIFAVAANTTTPYQDMEGDFELPLARVTVSTGGSITVTDVREFVGLRIRPFLGTVSALPAANSVRLGTIAFTLGDGVLSYTKLVSGTPQWVPVQPTSVNHATRWGPGTGYALIVSTSTPAVQANTIWIKPTS